MGTSIYWGSFCPPCAATREKTFLSSYHRVRRRPPSWTDLSPIHRNRLEMSSVNEVTVTVAGSPEVPEAERARRLADVYRLLLGLASRRGETEYRAEETHAEALAPSRGVRDES